MRKQNALKSLGQLLKNASFTIKEAESCGVSASTLAYYARMGALKRLGPGIYCNPESEIDTEFAWEDMVRIVTQIPEGVVCLITALSLYELTDEISREFWVAIPHSKRIPRIKKVRFVRMRNMILGVSQKKMGVYSIQIFDQERTIVDAFRYLDKEVAIKALKKFIQTQSNTRKLQDYAKKLRVNITPYILTVTT